MATTRRRWPKGANAARHDSIEAAKIADSALDIALTALINNPYKAEAMIYQAKLQLKSIELWLTTAQADEFEESKSPAG